MKRTILVVDDLDINIAVITSIFSDKYNVITALGGEACIKLVQENSEFIDLVLLNLDMPDVSGYDILKMRREGKFLRNVPVIILTASEDVGSQINAFKLGAADYITIPFVKEIAEFRVRNVLFFTKQILELERQRHHLQEKSETDLMTGLYNKVTTHQLIGEALSKNSHGAVFFIFDIDNFKQFNDNYGHSYGDKVISQVAAFIQRQFRQCDIIGRIGGDEFVAYMDNITPLKAIERKANSIIANLHDSTTNGLSKDIHMSIGIAYVDTRNQNKSYEELFNIADEALYEIKKSGKDNYKLISI